MFLDMPEQEVNIVVATDGYSGSFSELVLISVSCMFCALRVARSEKGPRDLEFLHDVS
jgi:hypothetical protein